MAMEEAIFGGGCFWCTEAVFQQQPGVREVVSGYAGGALENPSYKQICTGTTGHAEVIKVTFDADEVGFASLVDLFFRAHDPTTLNRQGHDVGTQYRSVIFFMNEEQEQIANEKKREFDESGLFPDPIVTEITPFTNFYPAETEHQNFYRENQFHPYCMAVIQPKLNKIAAP